MTAPPVPDLDTDLFIGGELVSSDGVPIAVENPATEEHLADVPDATPGDIDRAVAAARQAQRAWAKVDPLSRAELLHECAGRLHDARSALGRTLTLESGKTLKESVDEVEWCVTAFRHLAETARASGGRVVGPTKPGQMNFVVHDPVGVAVLIMPFNYPLALLAWQAAAALATGNACIVKPSELTPLATLQMARVLDCLPPGTFNVVTATGAGAARLVDHPGTDMIAFTGSVATGARIMAAAAPRIKKLLLELGGSDPFIVAGDAPLETAVPGAAFAAFLNAGQVCTSAERFYVERPLYDEFMSRLLDTTARIRVGDPLADVDVGSMISGPARDRIARTLDRLHDRGATVLAGGGVPTGLDRGYFHELTIVEVGDPAGQAPEGEVFGPLATVTPVDSVDQAIELANASPFGLGANIYTTSLRTAMRAATELRAGTVWINDPLKDNDAAPFGGQKMSGLGRELGSEGITAFCEPKHVHMDFEAAPSPEWWFPYERPDVDA
ncbi:MAG TPA: aldehyde dehydrogenase family protein [Baekduia sp.]|uniref:aldehyde dehydrogenase family protein n=1 Tax=Baekduia sp. TaxID=2600305 RepID=UPI002D795BE1|nr:aldehyde dehydrogenase family protein [Baekduia sp.]HET6509105.1 aldehyde dehydrogenase family protein [Baekduia sp.]